MRFLCRSGRGGSGERNHGRDKRGRDSKRGRGRTKEKGLITNDFAFWFQSIFYDYQDIYPGIYTLNTSMTSKEILRELNVKPEEESEASPEARTVSGEADLSKDADSSENRKTRAVQAELDGEDIYMEEEESGGWIEEAEE